MSDLDRDLMQKPHTPNQPICRKGPMDILNKGAKEGRLDDLSPEDINNDLGKTMVAAVFGATRSTRDAVKDDLKRDPNQDDWANK